MKQILVIIIVLGSLLFVDVPNYFNGRVLKQVWESGHFFLFAALVFFLLNSSPLKTKEPSLKFIITITFCVGFGLLTELLQLVIGRSFEFEDILNDLIGGLAGFSYIQFLQQKSRTRRSISILAIVIFTLLGGRSLIIAVIDDWQMKDNFPALSQFETAFEMSRWHAQLAELSISQKQSGNNAMQVNFSPGKYPGITLRYLVGNWQEYEQLQFSMFNDTSEQLTINVKVYDAIHPQSGYRHSDRFNAKVTLDPGWNLVQYSLNKIRVQPKNRLMDMTSIISFSLFLSNQKVPVTVYIDDVMLIGKTKSDREQPH